MTTQIPSGTAARSATAPVAAGPAGPYSPAVAQVGPVPAVAAPPAAGPIAAGPTAVASSAVAPVAAGPIPTAPGTASAPWSLIAAAAAAARDELASVLAAGLDAPGALDGLDRVSSTVAWVQDRLGTGVALPGDGTAMGDVIAARRSVAEARGLVLSALALRDDSPAARAPSIN